MDMGIDNDRDCKCICIWMWILICMARGVPEIHLSGGSSSRASTHSSTRCDRGCDVAN